MTTTFLPLAAYVKVSGVIHGPIHECEPVYSGLNKAAKDFDKPGAETCFVR